jgi:hypothetical protein
MTTVYPEQRIGETPKAYNAFTEYCDLGVDRSLAKLSQKLVKVKQNFNVWSVQHEWQKRVAEYDLAILEERARLLYEKRAEETEALRISSNEDAKTLHRLAVTLAEHAQRRIDAIHDGELEIKELAPLIRVVVLLYDTSINLRAVAQGLTGLRGEGNE